uniref:C-X-C motif chemokine n=1 Tax=Equus caballus TaxID=9796 RepID=A0A9L0SSB8_HORSE
DLAPWGSKGGTGIGRAHRETVTLTESVLPAGAPVVSELRCQCLQTVQGIHLKNIQSVKVTPAGSHCAQTEVIATLKNGQETCLNPEAPMVKKMIEKMLKNPQQEEEGGYTPGLVLSNWVTADKKHSEPPHPSLKIKYNSVFIIPMARAQNE